MRSRRLKAYAPLLACFLVGAVCETTAAKPGFGSNCTSSGCHSNAGGNLSISPDPIGIDVDSNGLLTFEILDNPGKGAIALTGLDDVGLDASVLGGGWTARTDYYHSSIFENTNPRTLDLGIGPAAVEGSYDIVVRFAGQGGFWGSTYGFRVDVTAATTLAGDFDLDGDVDGNDFLKWQRGESNSPFSQSDLDAWQMDYGSVATPITASLTAVPEPSTALLLVLAAAGICLQSRQVARPENSS